MTDDNKLYWTGVPPAEPGWYWRRARNAYGGVYIVNVYAENGSLRWLSERDDVGYPLPEGGEWAGPIPSPEPSP